jgi:hypothetical protein
MLQNRNRIVKALAKAESMFTIIATFRGVASGEEGEETPQEHEERGSGRMSHLEPEGTEDEFPAVPEADSGFNCQKIDDRSESANTAQPVMLFHSLNPFVIFFLFRSLLKPPWHAYPWLTGICYSNPRPCDQRRAEAGVLNPDPA